ncbi:hypothetical protein [Streptodolium elevatio]|uniref:TetR family transcriptional regulator n=1 Tax=Streptodolium elevatio TaxID=3157996 RepID=A0ABV3DB40_9ACTN
MADDTNGRRPRGRSGNAAETRDALMRVGARLISRHGLGVPASRIQEEADQRNKSALTYHFGSVAGLAAAIHLRHRDIVEQRRLRALEALAASESPEPSASPESNAANGDAARADLGKLVTLLVAPAAEELRTAPGRAYLRLLPQVAHLAEVRQADRPRPVGLDRTFALLRAHLADRGLEDVDERLALLAQMHATAFADRARRIDEMDVPDVDLAPGHDHFVRLLTGMLTAALTAD